MLPIKYGRLGLDYTTFLDVVFLENWGNFKKGDTFDKLRVDFVTMHVIGWRSSSSPFILTPKI